MHHNKIETKCKEGGRTLPPLNWLVETATKCNLQLLLSQQLFHPC